MIFNFTYLFVDTKLEVIVKYLFSNSLCGSIAIEYNHIVNVARNDCVKYCIHVYCYGLFLLIE